MGTRLFVGNLSWDTTDQTLRDLFSEGGRSVKDVHIVSDRETGKPRGFGFIEMSTPEEAQTVIDSLDGAMLDGRNIKVSEAQERQPRGNRGGGGGGW